MVQRYVLCRKVINTWINKQTNKSFQDQTSFSYGCRNYSIANKMRVPYTYYSIVQIMNYTAAKNEKLQCNHTYTEINKTYKHSSNHVVSINKMGMHRGLLRK